MRNKLLIAVLLIFSFGAESGQLDDAVEAMRSGDFAVAYCIMRPLAENGDSDAQYNIGWMYLNGYGLRVNDVLALDWWQEAASQGHADARFSIAMLYSMGEGKVKRDPEKAIDYYLLAMESGHDDAATMLQSMMLRNDREIRGRMHSIVSRYSSSFGVTRQVKAKKLNARKGPSVNEKIVTQLVQGQSVLEMQKLGRWSQVVILDDENIDQTVWVYNPLLEDAVKPPTG